MVRKDQTRNDGRSPKRYGGAGSPRRHRSFEGQEEEDGKSELHGDAAIDGRLGTGMVAHAGRDVAGRAVLVVETELVLPVAVGHPDVDKVRIFRTPHRLRGIEGQADRLGVELDGGVDGADGIEWQRIILGALLA